MKKPVIFPNKWAYFLTLNFTIKFRKKQGFFPQIQYKKEIGKNRQFRLPRNCPHVHIFPQVEYNTDFLKNLPNILPTLQRVTDGAETSVAGWES